MKRSKQFLISILLCLSALQSRPLLAQSKDSMYIWNDSSRLVKHPIKAAAEVFGLNMGVWAFDRYVSNAEFAEISINTIRHNIKNGFVWDNDRFSTNLFAHPYHGNLYFNLARSNGMSFWQSAPYAIGGSLMWETSMENEPPAINDFIATPIGGIALGEVTHRLSDLVLDDSRTGGSRVTREILAGLICPMKSLNRLISGDAWKVRSRHYKYHDDEGIPVRFSAGLYERYIADDNSLFKGENVANINLRVDYGDPLDGDSEEPYDYFSLQAGFNVAGNQPLISQINLVAKIAAKYMEPLPGHQMLVGIFQHFDFYDSEPVIDHSERSPFKLAETAAVGLGMIYQLPTANKRVSIRQSSFINAILLGGSISDHYHVVDRNYNMGSGFSLKGRTEINFKGYADFSLDVQHYQIYTWKGKNPEKLSGNPIYYNVQGDQGYAAFTIISPSLGVYIIPSLKLEACLSYYLRNTHYRYYNDVRFETFETKIGLAYEF